MELSQVGWRWKLLQNPTMELSTAQSKMEQIGIMVQTRDQVKVEDQRVNLMNQLGKDPIIWDTLEPKEES
jgi:hypothetical protein